MIINLAKQILSLIDLTSLNENDTDADIAKLCETAITAYGHVAAVCVYPQFVFYAKQVLSQTSIKIATVANFPHGTDSLDQVLSSIQQSIKEGAQEIDVVFPYKNYFEGKEEACKDFIVHCKAICGPQIVLKVILETGAFLDVEKIAAASQDALLSGADFIKTSTGKIAVGATIPAARVMLNTIKRLSVELNRPLGFKASGGIRTIQQASDYIALASDIMGQEWVTPQTFRLGTSHLIHEVLTALRSQ